MKIHITKAIIVAATLFSMPSCKKSFVDIEPKGQFLSENYYQNEAQAFSALVAVYDGLRKNSGGFENMITMMNAGSDDQIAGGGSDSDGAGIQGFGKFSLNSQIIPGSFWNDYYQGIFRANILLQKIPNTAMDETLKNRFIAETKTLRSWYYFNLLIMFRNIPLILEPLTTSNMYDVAQAEPSAVYAQIEADLLESIANLPPVITDEKDYGRLNKGAAQAILGKVYLYEGKSTEAATQLAEVNGTTPGQPNQYGNQLLTNFADLWLTDNKFNDEAILEVCHTMLGASDWGWWGASNDEGNSVNIMVGARSYTRLDPSAPDLAPGWSFNTFTQDFYDVIKNDPRYAATVLDLGKLEQEGKVQFLTPPHMATSPKLYLNKFMPRQNDIRTGGGAFELNFRQNTYAIRLADTYLLEAEALGGTGARAQALLDAVRDRVGLTSVPVSMDAIKKERRLELAGEGFRFFDLVRWGDAATKLASKGFTAGKDEIFPIPQRELQGTKLQQNPNFQ